MTKQYVSREDDAEGNAAYWAQVAADTERVKTEAAAAVAAEVAKMKEDGTYPEYDLSMQAVLPSPKYY